MGLSTGGLIAKILNFVSVRRNNANINDVTIKSGGGVNMTAEHFGGAGSDAQPTVKDYAYLAMNSGTGRHVVIGYLDPVNEGQAKAGERGILGRNPSDNTILCRVFVRNDGSIEIDNDNGGFLLMPNGTVNINGVTIDVNGNITSPANITAQNSVTAQNIIGMASVSASGKEMSNHTHPAGTPPGNTGVNN